MNKTLDAAIKAAFKAKWPNSSYDHFVQSNNPDIEKWKKHHKNEVVAVIKALRNPDAMSFAAGVAKGMENDSGLLAQYQAIIDYILEDKT